MKNCLVIVLLLLGMFSCERNPVKGLLFESLKEIISPVGPNSSLPHLVKGGDNHLYMSWIEKGDSNLVEFKYAMLDGDVWTKPERIAKGKDWFVNWADYPMLAVDKEGNKIASYLAKSANGTYSYDVNVVVKSADEKAWSSAIIPHKDGTPTEHGFVTMLPQDDDTFLIAWLDGRNTGESNHSHEEHMSGGAMTLRTAVIDMQGNLTEEAELDNRVCDCCQTGGVITSSGPTIIYRDRSEMEVRDMHYVQKKKGRWEEPEIVNADNWLIKGCPVNGPRIAAYGDRMVSAWFTMANEKSVVKASFMNGLGRFVAPIIIDDQMPLGRVDVSMISEDSALVTWMTNQGEVSVINGRVAHLDGGMGKVFLISEISESRGSGFPQMEIVDNQVYFAWTEFEDENFNILMKKMNLE